MTEILAIFKSRAQAVDCVARLRAQGINAVAVNTPKEAGVGCGLSVKFAQRDINHARMTIARAGYSAFYGYLRIARGYGGTSFYPLF